MKGNVVDMAVGIIIIVAAAIFVAIRAMNHLRAKQAAAPPPEPPAEVKLLGEIRDLFKAGRGSRGEER